MVVKFAGSIVSIPSGWVLCDGNNGTPDLRNRFIVGAGDTYNPGIISGEINHNHPFTGDGHDHELVGGTDIAGGANFDATTSSDAASGMTDAQNGLPPYYSLAYVMKT